jgi:hypothetical protein
MVEEKQHTDFSDLSKNLSVLQTQRNSVVERAQEGSIDQGALQQMVQDLNCHF